ncbi:MAG: redoxin domain-containing protein, partial [Lentisphaerota bacterium]
MLKAPLLVLAACLAGFSGPLRADDTGALAVAQSMAGKLSAIKTMRQDGALVMEFEIEGAKETTEMPFTLLYEQPNLFLMSNDFVYAVSDGTTVTFEGSKANRYYQTKAQPAIAEILKGSLDPVWKSLLPDKKALFSKDPEEVLSRIFTESAAELFPDEKIEGHDCWVLEMNATRDFLWFQSPRARMWIDQSNGLIRCIESLAGGKNLSGDKDADVQQFKQTGFRYVLSSLVVNEPLDRSVLTWQASEKDRKVRDPEELFGMSRKGLSRSALSGKAPPDFSLPLLSGGTFRLADHTGSVVVVDFWSTWGGPGAKTLPDMQALSDRFKDQGVIVVGISRDMPGQKDKVLKALEEAGVTYDVGIDEGRVADQFGVSSIPCFFLLDRDGVVQGCKVGYSQDSEEDLSESILKLLAGEKLSSSEPMTEDEIEAEREERAASIPVSHTVMDTNFFLLKWRTNVVDRPSLSFDRNAVQHRLPLRRFLVHSERGVNIIDPSSGQITGCVKPPPKAEAKNEQGDPAWLPTAENRPSRPVSGIAARRRSGAAGPGFHGRLRLHQETALPWPS